MKLRILFLFFLLLTSVAFSQEKLSNEAQISLITVGPGNYNDELYTSFGHTGILIEDPENGFQKMYNYGTFDFETENFYIKFLQGQLPYQISVNNFSDVLNYYSSINRLITKQLLNLSAQQKQAIYNALEKNYLPENRYYLYKFFYDNCSTRVRDILLNPLKDSVTVSATLNSTKSYRDWIDKMAGDRPWSDFGMNLAIGVPSDAMSGSWGAMYIPQNLMEALDSAKIKATGQPFVVEKIDLNSIYITKEERKPPFFTPTLVAILLLFMFTFLSFYELKKKKMFAFVNSIWFGVLTLAGLLLVFLWFFTDHGVTKYNFNLVWLFPFIFFFRKNKNVLFFYGTCCLLFVLFSDFLPQDIHKASLILATTTGLRALFSGYYLSKFTN
jgi:Domain of unknown function (DUF4105)